MDKTVKTKVFVSYSRRDAGDFADQIQKHIGSFANYDVFTDEKSIGLGDIWSDMIETNISRCDVFIAIVTYGALRSPHVEKEVLQAHRDKKKIIPCFHKTVRKEDVKWGLNKIQGVDFSDKYDLARDLYSKIAKYNSDSQNIANNTVRSSDWSSDWSRKERVKRRWTNLIILAIAISVAVLMGRVFVPIIHDQLTEGPVPITPTPTPPPSLTTPLSVSTDKKSYGFGDTVMISGSVEKPAQGETIRIDVYDPTGAIFEPFDSNVSDYVFQSNIKVKPDDKGQFSYRLPTDVPIPPFRVNGTYTVEGTFEGVTRNTTFTIR